MSVAPTPSTSANGLSGAKPTPRRIPEPINPFVPTAVGSRPVSVFDVVKTCITAVTLLPVRLVGVALCMLLEWVFARLAIAFLPDEALSAHPPRSLSRPRQLLVGVMRLLFRLQLFIAGYYWIEEKGRPAARHEAPILVCNHRGFVEPIYLAARHGSCFVAAAENVDVPLFSAMARAMQTILVDRASPTSRADVLAEISRRALSEQPFPQVAVFPEGTVTNGTTLISFKHGAFAPGAAVQPVIVKLPHSHADPSWVYGNGSSLKIVLRLLTQFVNHMQVEYLPPYVPNAAERADPQLFAANVRERMASALGVPTTGHSQDDVVLQTRAARLGMPTASAVVGAAALQAAFGVDRDGLKAALAEFARLDARRRGELTLAEWLGSEGAPAGDGPGPAARGGSRAPPRTPDAAGAGPSPTPRVGEDVAARFLRAELELAFRALDVDGDGVVTFADWLHAALLMRTAGASEAHRRAAEVLWWAALTGTPPPPGPAEAAEPGGLVPRERLLRLVTAPPPGLGLSDQAALALWAAAHTTRDDALDFSGFRRTARARPELLACLAPLLLVRLEPELFEASAESGALAKSDGAAGAAHAEADAEEEFGEYPAHMRGCGWPLCGSGRTQRPGRRAGVELV